MVVLIYKGKFCMSPMFVRQHVLAFTANRRKGLVRRGVTMVEYGLVAGLIGVVAITGLRSIGSNASGLYCSVSSHLASTMGVSTLCANKTAIYSVDNQDYIGNHNGAIDAFMISLLANGITKMSGIYDQYGNAITTPGQYLTSIGLDSSLYDKAIADHQTILADEAELEPMSEGSPGYQSLLDKIRADVATASASQTALSQALYNKLQPSSAAVSTSATSLFIPSTSAISYSTASGTLDAPDIASFVDYSMGISTPGHPY